MGSVMMTKPRFLLKEYCSFIEGDRLQVLKENAEKSRPLVVTGVIQRADAKNQNGRIYPYDILRKKCDEYMENLVKKMGAIGELDHADDSVVHLANASHVIDDIWWEGKDVFGKVRLLNTPSGNVAKNIVLDGIPLGISSRAIGSVSKNESSGEDVVGEDLELIAWDLVGVPSTHGAYLKLTEAKVIGETTKKIIAEPRESARMRASQLMRSILKKS